jgi:HAD superfamily hydrolase (TIGR01549 family)
MEPAIMRYPVLLFDLFRTVLLFTPQAPTGQVREPTWRSAMAGLRARAVALLPGLDYEAFLDALYAASLEIARARAPEHRETPIEQRYRRALARLGYEGPQMDHIAEALARLQLDAQAAHTTMPHDTFRLLEQLARRRRLGVVSNFDHGPTAHAILARHGLTHIFSASVISIEYGRRKPHPAIFEEALRRLDASPQQALFTGDSLADDVAGAQGVGMDTAWLNWHGELVPVEGPKPTCTLSRFTDLAGVLD